MPHVGARSGRASFTVFPSAETVAWEAGHLARNESAELALLCRNGLVVVAPSASALEAWKRAAAAPTDPSARRVVDDITSSVLHTLPADGAADVPKSCPIATSAAEAHNLHRSARPDVSASVPPTDGPSIPVGTYQERVTVEQFAAAGVYGPDYNEDVTFTWLFRPDGTFLETQKPDYPDQGPQLGHYVVDGNRLTMTYDPTPSGNLPPERVHWSYYEGTLTFSHLEIEDSGSLPLYMQPWHKTA